jgi:hypothetical protein
MTRKAPAFSISTEGQTHIYEWHTGQELQQYQGECLCYGADSGPALFRTWLHGGERHWRCLRIEGTRPALDEP